MASAFSRSKTPLKMFGMLWGRQVAGRNYPPTNKNTLIRAPTEEWDKLPQQLLDNVVQNSMPKLWRWRLMVSPIYRTFREFRRANSYCHLYGAQGQRQAYFWPLATMNFMGLDLTKSS
ncbi:hypothetical protein TNCV_1078981, partial [Trichonephila clavipes]